MVTEDKMYEEIDKATEAQMIVNLIDNYSMLLRIKYASDLGKEIENELKVMEVKMKYMNIDFMPLKKHFNECDECETK